MPYYRCDNFGKCDIADTGEPIELPPGAEPICPEPTCHEPLSPAGNSSEDPVFLASLGTPDQGGRRLFYPIALFILLVIGLVGGIAYLIFNPPGPEALTLEVPPQIIASVGESVQVPVTVKPATAENVTLTVEGKLPPGMVLDGPGRRLDGTVQSPGSFPVIFRADSPRFGRASAMTRLVVNQERGVPAGLALWAEPHVLGRVGEPLEVPIGIGPAGMEGATLSVEGDLPAGVRLDASGKRLYGTPESAGSSDVVLTASAPGYAGASTPMDFTILEAKPTPVPVQTEVTPNLPVQVAVSPSPAVQAEVTPNSIKPSPTPASVADNASEDLLAEPTLGDEATPAVRNALRHCDRVALSFTFDRRDFVALDRSSVYNLNRLVTFLRGPGMSKRPLVVVGCTDGTGTRLENNFYARSRAVAFVGYLQKAGIKNPIDQLLGSGGDYLVLRKDSSARESQSNRRVDVYLKR
jgi:outer membrane protein OmpA-like peptidoglycan-associated protein